MAQPRQIPSPAQTWLRALVDAEGVGPVAKRLNLSDATVARAAGGLPVQEGTVVMVEAAFQAFSATNAAQVGDLSGVK